MKNTLLASKRLAISESGFVFDPVSGQSFSVNETGLVILHLAQHEDDLDKLVEQLAEQFDASILEINRDVQDFIYRLKGFLK
ncbi:MAG: PqqD family protein [Methylococcales bacterium]|nr:PqqD family protein [Methylococcales bacterium]